MTKVAINGFGRIGRALFKIISRDFPEIEIVAINDLSSAQETAHLLKYDSLYGIYEKDVALEGDFLVSDSKKTKLFSERDPLDLPWQDLGVDIVLECTGHFRDYAGAKKHLDAGAQYVVISAPSRDPDKINSYIIGVNIDSFNHEQDRVIDIGSCTTNCLAPIAKILNDKIGIKKGFITTVHSYTNDQRLLDVSHSDLRRARAAAINIIPTTTGAAKALGRVIPQLEGKIDGISLRVPTPTVSVLDLFCELEKETTEKELNDLFNKASQEKEYQGILAVEDAPLVSSDYIGNSFSSIIDSSFTMSNGNLAKIVAWYDNEWGYACRLAETAKIIHDKIN